MTFKKIIGGILVILGLLVAVIPAVMLGIYSPTGIIGAALALIGVWLYRENNNKEV